ncbi:hypothetical protein [Mesorhizobium sp.]|nr:hypothetical protein [Mesorhizobium sp.]RWI35392.1 MAG: hypothetical protein EOR14_28220 [Mesorhizobium sp.]
MVLLLAATGAIVVLASYFSKWDAQKRMKKLREEEKTFKDKVSKFRAKKMSTLEDVASAVAVRSGHLGTYDVDFLTMARGLGHRWLTGGGNVIIVETKDDPSPRRVKAQAASRLTKGTRHG